MNNKKNITQNFLGVGVLRLLAIPLGFAISIILARKLGPENFGHYTFIMALIPLLALPVSGGLPQLLTREIATSVLEKNWPLYRGALRACHASVILLSAVTLVGYWVMDVGLNLIPSNGAWPLLSIALLLIPFSGLSSARTGTIKGLGYPAYAEIPSQLIQPMMVLVLLAYLAYNNELDKYTAVWSQAICAIIIFLIASVMFIKAQPKEAKNVAPEYQSKRWRKALVPFSLIALVSTLNSKIGIVILGAISDADQVAAMSIAERGGQFVGLSLTLVNMVIAPYIVSAYREKDRNQLQELSRVTARGSLLIALPVTLTLMLA